MRLCCGVAVIVLMLLAGAIPAAGAEAQAQETPQQRAERMAWWREARFGLFIHWGPVSLKGTEIGWSRGQQVPADVYDNLYKQFNPTKFDARQWVAIAKAAGMKYIVFTTRHHDGFCEFDSQLTDYKITNSPFGRDVVKELAEACHESGMRLGFYYSQPDFRNPDWSRKPVIGSAAHQRFVKYIHGQVRELLSNYGKVDVLWFDGLGGKAADWDAVELFKTIRQLQPAIIVNNRCGLPADYDTPEQHIGAFQNTRPWETCMTICNQWAWKPGDPMKSLKVCLQNLIRCAGGDGNFLFNVGPMPTGEIEPRQVARLKEMGAWLEKYGQSIYGTRGGPFRTTPWLASTYRGNTIYVHVLDWKGQTLHLPAISKKIVSAKLLTGGEVKVAQDQQGIAIDVAPEQRQEIDTLIELQLDGAASEIPVCSVPSDSLAAGKKATASNVYARMAEHAAGKAFDDDPSTRWATDAGTHAAWIEVDLGKPTEIGSVFIDEAYAGRVQRFEVQVEDAGAWKTIVAGTRLGEKFTRSFAPVTARRVRLNILQASEGPTINEIQVFGAKR